MHRMCSNACAGHGSISKPMWLRQSKKRSMQTYLGTALQDTSTTIDEEWLAAGVPLPGCLQMLHDFRLVLGTFGGTPFRFLTHLYNMLDAIEFLVCVLHCLVDHLLEASNPFRL
eukprot:TRINITY_DN13229_c0_g1_i2.p3 TRINITY_DN13229_c0_g1~~TRINITY_DN13229_c0_g1_i2.p3  ORF type:complete len:114 (-),score=12.15 TRINITY_DN13229_c0_g1_i2:132-473(-)